MKERRVAESDKKRSTDSLFDEKRCACCLKPFLIERGADCSDCGAKSCRKSCSRWDQEEETWRCLFCCQRRTWLRKNKKFLETLGRASESSTATSQSLTREVQHEAINHNLDLAAGFKEKENSMETVRDIVEKIVEGLIGNVDNTPVNRIYDHPAYKTASTSNTHAALKELVERAVDEARKLPGLRNSETEKEIDQSMSDRSYEDLLATAILNKVIEKFQNEYVDGNSNVLRQKSTRCTNSEFETGIESRQEEDSTGLDPLSQDDYSSDCSATQAEQFLKHSQPLSMTIEERIEEVTTTYTSDEEASHEDENGLDFRNSRRVPFPEFGMDIVDPTQDSSDESLEESIQDLVLPVESWEENWLFQKRKIQARSESVAMLVPNASADFRALIGDRDAEDTSDLSECSVQSDEEIEQELTMVIDNVSPKPLDSEKESSNSEPSQLENLDTFSNLHILENYKKSDKILQKTDGLSEIVFSNEENNKSRVEKISSIKENSCPALNISKSNSQKSSTKEFSQTIIEQLDPIGESCPKAKNLTSEIPAAEAGKESESHHEKINVKEGKEVNKSIRSGDKDCQGKSQIEEDGCQSKSMTNGHHKFDGEDGIQQESEYTEHYDKATQKHMDSLKRAYGPMGIDETDQVNDLPPPIIKSPPLSLENFRKCREAAAIFEGETSHRNYVEEKKLEEEVEFSTPPRPGTIAEREHRKWENAPPIENNPYSEENIQKRLLERQYSRRSEIAGNNTEAPKATGNPLQILLGAKRLDVKRFGRDYYINDAMRENGDRQRRSANTSRPTSSMSQHSSSTGSDLEQDRMHYNDSKTLSSPENEKSKVSNWQKNNEFKDEPNEFQSLGPRKQKLEKTPTMKVTHCFNIEEIVSSETNWGSSKAEKLSENARKNNKNEMNARLNNQECITGINTLEPSILEENKKIRRLDLRAYGFENNFNKNGENPNPLQKRVVKKLDLKSFGYESGLRRTQSIQLDSRNNNEDNKPKIIRVKSKSNLSQSTDILKEGNESYDSTNSTDDLNTESQQSGNYFEIRGMFSAKSVPNIADNEHYDNSHNVNMVKCKYERRSKHPPQKNEIEEKRIHQIKDKSKVENEGKCSETSAESFSEERGSSDNSSHKKAPLPSVRRLAEAFSKSTEKLNPTSRISKSPNKTEKERPTTPEIDLVETPRQMHSLTARSLSKEFREGLRQISKKVMSPPASHSTIEQKNCESQTILAQNEKNSLSGDISIISPGKLKNNIQFWEQLQRR